MDSTSSSSSVNPSFRYTYCHCGAKMYFITSWTKQNPGRRFVKCPNVKTGSCTRFSFVDEPLPSDYYKGLLYELHSQRNNKVSKPAKKEEEDESNHKLEVMKAMEELTFTKSKLKIFDLLFFVLIVVVALLSFVIAVLVM